MNFLPLAAVLHTGNTPYVILGFRFYTATIAVAKILEYKKIGLTRRTQYLQGFFELFLL